MAWKLALAFLALIALTVAVVVVARRRARKHSGDSNIYPLF